jgi:hypothetical protein
MRALLIRSVGLPTQIREAIGNKLKTRKEPLASQYRLEREKSEAERRRIEADGLVAYIRIVNSSLTGNILKQKEIDEPIELAKSSNSKIVVVGNGNKSMPLIVANN